MLHDYLTLGIGLMLITISSVILVFPPKIDNQFYGIRTKLTEMSATIWVDGQRLFAISGIGIGFIFSILWIFKIHNEFFNIALFGILVGLWAISKYVVHQILSKKYSL